MNLSTSHLRSLLTLTEKKDAITKQLAEIDAQIAAAISPAKPVAPVPAKPAKRGRKPGKAAKAKPAKRGRKPAKTAEPEPANTVPITPEKTAQPAKRARKSRKPAKVKPAAKLAKPAKSGGTKERILGLLAAAGTKGMHSKDIASQLGLSHPAVSVWFSTTGKKLTKKIAPAHFALK